MERLVEESYAGLIIPGELREGLERTLLEEYAAGQVDADRERRSLTLRQQRLSDERTKLLQAYYAGALPVELLKSEQGRLSRQLDEIESRLTRLQMARQDFNRRLREAFALLDDCHAAYLAAPDHVRRLMNQAFFEAIYLEEDDVRVELAEPFATLLGAELRDEVQAVGPAEALGGPQDREEEMEDPKEPVRE